MAVNLYEPFTNRIAGETFHCTSDSPESFAMDWIVQPNGYVPFEHIHLFQDEIFNIKSGELRVVIEGKEVIGRAGDSVIVPKGKRHIAFNNKLEPIVCLTEYRPALDSYKFFQSFGGLTIDKDMDKRGQINIPKMLSNSL